jgi:hypothetical protein
MFENRETGKLTIAQWPNIPLAVFLVTLVARLAFHPAGTAGRALQVVGTLALIVWAADEIVRGVNPFRRLLGAVVLIGQAVALAQHLLR